MLAIILFFLSTWIGYLFFLYFTHPLKKKNKVPHIGFKNVELLPNIKIHYHNKTYHFHHWLVLSVLMAWMFGFYEGVVYFLLVKGAAIGGIVQGLRYPDRFKFKYDRVYDQVMQKNRKHLS